MIGRTGSWTVLAVLVQFSRLASAVFQHDAYDADWHHSLIGPPSGNGLVFRSDQPTLGSDRRLLFALGSRNVVGAVDVESGESVWRHRFEDDDRLIVRPGRGPVGGVVVGRKSGLDRYRFDGRLVWSVPGNRSVDAVTTLESQPPSADASGDGDVDDEAVYVLRPGLVQKMTGGKLSWQSAVKDGLAVRIAVGRDAVYVVSLVVEDASKAIRIDSFDRQTGAIRETYSVGGGSQGPNCAGCVVFVGGKTPIVAWKDKSHENLLVNVLGQSKVATVNLDIPSVETLEKVEVVMSDAETDSALVVVTTKHHHWARPLRFNRDRSAVTVDGTLARRPGRAVFAAVTDGKSEWFVRVTGTTVSVLDSGLDTLQSWPVADNETVAEPVVGQAVASVGPDGVVRVNATVVGRDGRWTMLDDGRQVWSRPEFLARAVAVAIADPVRSADLGRALELEGEASIVDAYVHRVKRHAVAVRDELIPWMISTVTDFRAFFNSRLDRPGRARRFGYDKIVVVATDTGRVAALSFAHDGAVLWNTDLRTIEPDGKWTAPRIAIVEPGVVAVRTGEVSDEQAHVVQLDVQTGKPLLEDDASPFTVGGLRRLFDQDAVAVRHEVVGDEVVGRRDGVVEPVWRFSSVKGEKIRSVVQRPPHDPTASLGKVLADRTVLYKYLNPNVLVVTSVDEVKKTVSITALDGISGRILFEESFERVDTSVPVLSIVRENWIATTFQQLAPDRVEIRQTTGPIVALSEMFESPLPNDRGPFGNVANGSVVEFPDYPNPDPFVRGTSFALVGLDGPIVGLSAMRTQQSITVRQLIISTGTGVGSDGVYTIPVGALDPRRPIGSDPVAAELAEGLTRYSAVIPISPTWTLTHRREVMFGKPIIRTKPTGLESTGVVVIGGLDVFASRVSPSGTFDSLPDGPAGFDKLQVMGTIVVLGLMVLIVRPRVSARIGREAWIK